MSKTSFKAFIEKEKSVDSRIKSINWEERKNLYLYRLKTLFRDVEVFLRQFTESNDIQIKKGKKRIEEDYIGKYEVPVLRIQLYEKYATLVPVGTLMIGTPGCVDLVGEIETIRFALADKNEDHPQPPTSFSLIWLEEDDKNEEIRTQDCRKCDYVWKIMTAPPYIRYLELNEDSFLSALQEVLDA